LERAFCFSRANAQRKFSANDGAKEDPMTELHELAAVELLKQ
jgi:hypothetical protein